MLATITTADLVAGASSWAGGTSTRCEGTHDHTLPGDSRRALSFGEGYDCPQMDGRDGPILAHAGPEDLTTRRTTISRSIG